MSDEKLLARIGLQQLQLEDRASNYVQLLNLLARVISGDVARSRVMVNLTNEQWFLSEPGQSPAMPATMNGLPVCIVGTADPVQDGIDAIAARNLAAQAG